MSAIGKKTLIWSMCVLDFVIIWFLGLFWFGIHIKEITSDHNRKVDAIIVLTGGSNRIAEGARLLNKGLADKMFISGVSKDVSIKDIEKESQIEIKDPDRVELGYKATNTIENASEIAQWIKQNNISSVYLITSNYHIPRSLAELKPYNLSTEIILHPVYSDMVKQDWWQSFGSFKFIVSEYNKFLFAYIRSLIF